MPNIITRYLSREILKNSSAILLILYIILMSNALGRVLADIADGDIPVQALWPILLSQSVGLLSMLLPFGFFLGIVFAFGRLYTDHEIIVMNASGMGYRDFYKPVLWVALPVLALSAYTSIWLNAQVQRSAQEIVAQEKDVGTFDLLKAGQFNQDQGGRVIFIESMSQDKRELSNLIISQSSPDRMILETAEKGRHKIDDKTGDLFLVVGPGERTESQAGEKDVSIMRFQQHGILIQQKKTSGAHNMRSEEKPPSMLWTSSVLDDRVELHWRIANPVVLLVLALLAVPLSYIAPRKGRYGKVGYALLIFIVYFNLLWLVRGKLETHVIPVALNFWGVHFVFLVFTLGYLVQSSRNNWFKKKALSA